MSNREELIKALHAEFHGEDDLIPLVEESKYIEATGSLSCSALDIDMKDLINLKNYAQEFQQKLSIAGAKDYPKLQSSLYVGLAVKCIDFVIRSKEISC